MEQVEPRIVIQHLRLFLLSAAAGQTWQPGTRSLQAGTLVSLLMPWAGMSLMSLPCSSLMTLLSVIIICLSARTVRISLTSLVLGKALPLRAASW